MIEEDWWKKHVKKAREEEAERSMTKESLIKEKREQKDKVVTRLEEEIAYVREQKRLALERVKEEAELQELRLSIAKYLAKIN